MYYLETGSTDPYYNLAFEEYVLRNYRDDDYLILWQNDNTVVLGQNQNAMEEINQPFVDAHHIKVVRRCTGGGAVYHDLGNLNYSFITDAERGEETAKRRLSEPVVRALHGLGIQAELSGRNDILVESCRVSGTAQRLMGQRILHHGTLLFRSNLEMMAGALRVNPDKFASKSIKSVQSRVANLCEFLPQTIDMRAFWDSIKQSLCNGTPHPVSLQPQETEAVRRLKTEKYATWQWNFGRSPRCDVTNQRRWNGGTLEVSLQISEGRIEDIGFFGDFLSLDSPRTVEQALTGIPFTPEEVQAVLSELPLPRFFGTITDTEILSTLFLDDK